MPALIALSPSRKVGGSARQTPKLNEQNSSLPSLNSQPEKGACKFLSANSRVKRVQLAACAASVRVPRGKLRWSPLGTGSSPNSAFSLRGETSKFSSRNCLLRQYADAAPSPRGSASPTKVPSGRRCTACVAPNHPVSSSVCPFSRNAARTSSGTFRSILSSSGSH